MKKILLFSLTFFLSTTVFALSGQAYMNRFTTWLAWNEQLPQTASPELNIFIQEDTPLARKLREKWLYQLARKHEWAAYQQYYKPSADKGLVCLSIIAQYELGETDKAEEETKKQWLTGDSQPPICNQLFKKLLTSENFDEKLITTRIQLALAARNLELALALLKQYKTPRINAAKLLQKIANKPTLISTLDSGELAGDFYLYGLKKMVSSNLNQAVNFWNMPKTKALLNQQQRQEFLVFITIYKALRNSSDTLQWFKKIKPAHYNNPLIEWQIRFALTRHNWKEVARLIQAYPEKDNPCWQYWLARALQAQGQGQQAQIIYENLANNRHYYGFLASFRINKNPALHEEKPVTNPAILVPYQPLLKLVEKLYNSGNTAGASRLLNDFASELPREDNSALVYWISHHLQWYEKSIHLSSNEALNNQLTLRFPLAYQSFISRYAQQYNVPAAFILAIIKQESGFRNAVTSRAGARGLMQLMPTTASMVARLEKITFTHPSQLFVSDKNINLGVAYLSQLYKRYDKHLVLIAAAYNAGPKQLNYWLAHHQPREIDLWVETLPWQETRNYLKNVIAFYTVYQYRMQLQTDYQQILRSL